MLTVDYLVEISTPSICSSNFRKCLWHISAITCQMITLTDYVSDLCQMSALSGLYVDLVRSLCPPCQIFMSTLSDLFCPPCQIFRSTLSDLSHIFMSALPYLYVVLSDLYADLSISYVDLSLIHLLENKS